MPGKEYRFNPETLTYEEVREPLRLRIYRLLRKGLVVIITVCIVNLLFSFVFHTPKMDRIARENEELLLRYALLDDRIREDAERLDAMHQRDISVYRPLFGADSLDITGIYVPYPDSVYAYLDAYPYGDRIKASWQRLDRVTRRTYLQSRSLDELQLLATDKEHMATAIPAIWPIDKRDLRNSIGAYGGRMHPIYKRYIKHDGIDLPAKIGDPVYATGNGVVQSTDIGFRNRGYGRQILIDHGFGYKTRYAHLSQIDVEPGQHVTRGEQIGRVGNTGASTGPHLHYEIRDTETQRLYNPVREGIIRPRDEYPPRIVRLHYVEVDTVQGVPVRSVPESYAVVRTAAGRYALTHDGPVGVGRRGYFVAEVTDRRNDVWNSFGVWRVTAFADGIPCFEFRMDSFTYDISRCSDAVSCYPIQINSRNEAIRLAQLEGAPDSFYPTMAERGLIRTAEGQVRRIRIEAEDDCGNVSTLEFAVRGRAGEFRAEADTTAVTLRPDRTSVLRVGREAEVRIPEGTIYEPIFVRPGLGEAPQADSGVVVLSPAYRFFNPATPLFRAVEVTLRARVPRPLQLHAQLAVRTRRGSLACVGGAYADGAGTASGRTSGDRGRHAAARDPSALRRRRRPHPGRRGAVPRRGQLLGHRLVEAAHRRQMGSLRPFSDERNAGSFLRRAGAAAHPRRASFGHRRMRKRNAFRRNILPLTNDGFGKNFLYLRELQRNTQ